MKIKDVMYKDDGKVETRLRFGDNLALVVSAPVRVAIEGDTSGLDEEEVNKLCRELEQGIARELDFRLFELCVKITRVAGGCMDLLDREEIADSETHFALYHPDFNWWECQACRFIWEFENGDPYHDDMRFCPRCGRRIVRERNKSKVTILPTVRASDCDGKKHLAGAPDQA